MRYKYDMCKACYKEEAKKLGWDGSSIISKIGLIFKTLLKNLHKLFSILNNNYIYLRQCEIVLTTKCSLRCRECANLMQYYEKTYDININIIEKSIDNLLNRIDEINTIVLVGGEPLLYKQINDVIEYIVESPKVNNINIFTNGTIVPNKDTIVALQNKKVKIIISDYGDVSSKKKELIMFCEKYGINYYLKNKDLYWGYIGGLENRNRTSKELSQQFKKCDNFCRSILNAKLYYCPRAGHGDDLGYIETKSTEYVDLLDTNITTDDILRIIYSKNYFSACNYCNYGTKEMIQIKPGEQMKYGEKKDIFKE